MNKRKMVSKIAKYSGALKALRAFSGRNILRILMYHRVFDKGNHFSHYLDGVRPADFKKQMQFLSKNFSVIAIEEAIKRIESGRPLPKKAISITVDDGYKDCYTNIYPVLREYGLSATIYLTTDNIDSKNAFWADKVGYLFKEGRPNNRFFEHQLLGTLNVASPEQRINALRQSVPKLKALPETDKNKAIDDLKDFFQLRDEELQVDYNLTWHEVKEMSVNGIFFGAHTVTHPILTRVSPDDAEMEIKQSKEKIEQETGRKIHGFCYPNGEESDFNDTIIGLLKKAGFKYALTTLWGFNDINSDLLRLKRVGPNSDDDLDRFECIVSGGFEVTNRLRKIFGVGK